MRVRSKPPPHNRPAHRIAVQYAVPRRGVPAPRALHDWARHALMQTVRPANLVLRLVGTEEGTTLNRTYRRKPGPTNVLSFVYDAAVDGPVTGDIVLCAPLVLAEALAQDKPVRAHWAHLVVHGVLHTLGYDHEYPEQAAVMETLEQRLMAALGYADPYAA